MKSSELKWTDAKFAMDVQQAKHETGRARYALTIERQQIADISGSHSGTGVLSR
jgi:hypothetical protein